MNHSEKHADKIYYEQAAIEIRSGNIDRGLMVKALSQCKGNKQQAEILYVEWRVELLQEEEKERIKNRSHLEQERKVKAKAEQSHLEQERKVKAKAEQRKKRRELKSTGWDKMYELNERDWKLLNSKIGVFALLGVLIIFLLLFYYLSGSIIN